jgi:hypothetical protein
VFEFFLQLLCETLFIPRRIHRDSIINVHRLDVHESVHRDFIFINIQPLGRFSRNQNTGDRYGSGTLHPGQVLRGRLPLLSPAFRRSHLLRLVPSRPTTRETSSSESWNLRGREMFRKISSRIRLPRNSRVLLHAANLRHGTGGFTSPLKEGVLRIYTTMKITNTMHHIY